MTGPADHKGRVPEIWVDGEGLDSVKSILQLIEEKRGCPRAASFSEAVRGLPATATTSLIVHLGPTIDPLLLWARHLELDQRGIAPCLRWPQADDAAPQLAFVTWLADVHWLAKRWPTHATAYARWRNLFRYMPATEQWHRTARWVYRPHKHHHYYAKGLGLSDEQRQPLMTMQTNAMRSDRNILKRLPDLRDAIRAYAEERPDKSSRRSPAELAERRARILRLYLLAGRSQVAAVRYLEQLTGERTMAYRRREAGPVLADLFGYFGIDHAIIVGHSDGGAMGLMAAAHHPDTIHGVLALVPQILMHPSSAEGMHAARQAFESGKLRSGLARYHGDNTEAMFWGWYGAWTTPEAFAWSMADEISRIRCPISVLYGMQDEYGYKPNIEVLIEHYDTLLELVTLPACGHHPQHQARDEVLAMAVRLLARPGVVAPRPDLA
mgnify:CR=1 FL=1